MKEQEAVDELASYGCVTLVQGRNGRVGIMPRVIKDWNKLDAKVRARVKRGMAEWCEGRLLPRNLYKSGGKYGQTKGGNTVAVFRSGQARLYGFERHLDGIRTFLVADCDPAKKQDDADADLIARLKVRIDAFGKEN